ncbi:MAG TPA: hypothetical protein VM183_19740 [Burkholderiales bacterium]|nr:hypothetical protein [Burkholderiales bacterium]
MIPPDQEIFEVEKRIAERRHRVEAAAKQTSRSALRALTSPWALAGAAVVGFLLAGGMQRRHAHAPDTRVDPSTKKAAKASALSGLAMTAVTWIIKSQFGSPVALAQFFLAKMKKQPDPRVPSAPARASSRADRPTATTRR